MSTFRVIKTIKRFSAHNDVVPQHVNTEVIWEGPSAKELSLRFPVDPASGSDPLSSERSSDGLVHHSYAIQQRATIGGSWLNIGDPRPRVGQEV